MWFVLQGAWTIVEALLPLGVAFALGLFIGFVFGFTGRGDV